MNRALLSLIIKDYRRLLIVLAVLAGACLLLWLYLLGPRRQQLLARQDEWTTKRRQTVQAATNALPDRATLDRQWAALPERNELPRILGQLYDIAGLSEVSVTALSYSPQANPSDGLAAYALKCTASGRYGALKRFLAELHRLPGMATVTSISLNSKDPLKEQVTLDTQISIHLRSGAAP